MGLFRGAVLRHGGGARKQPTPLSSRLKCQPAPLALMGQEAVLPLENSLENSP